MTTRILALTRYGQDAASTRQRFTQFAPVLAEGGFELRTAPLFDSRHMSAIDTGRGPSPARLALPYLRRLHNVLRRDSADILWVQYELFPFLPGLVEKSARLTGRPLVLDFDDAYFHRYDCHRSRLVRRLLGRKLHPLIASAAEVVVGNAYLGDYVRQWNQRVTIVPTVVDTDSYQPGPAHPRQPVTIGWIGSPTTWRVYVRPYLGLLREICEETGARLLIVGAGDVPASDVFAGMSLRSWDEAREVADIQEMDIGIMPLPDDPWARGKCGYKLIQYMACGLPTVASPVGVNSQIVVPDRTGLLANSMQSWGDALRRLIADPQLRQEMGRNGRQRVVDRYSLASQGPVMLDVMRRARAQLSAS